MGWAGTTVDGFVVAEKESVYVAPGAGEGAAATTVNGPTCMPVRDAGRFSSGCSERFLFATVITIKKNNYLTLLSPQLGQSSSTKGGAWGLWETRGLEVQ